MFRVTTTSVYDARLERHGWSEPGHDDSDASVTYTGS